MRTKLSINKNIFRSYLSLYLVFFFGYEEERREKREREEETIVYRGLMTTKITQLTSIYLTKSAVWVIEIETATKEMGEEGSEEPPTGRGAADGKKKKNGGGGEQEAAARVFYSTAVPPLVSPSPAAVFSSLGENGFFFLFFRAVVSRYLPLVDFALFFSFLSFSSSPSFLVLFF